MPMASTDPAIPKDESADFTTHEVQGLFSVTAEGDKGALQADFYREVINKRIATITKGIAPSVTIMDLSKQERMLLGLCLHTQKLPEEFLSVRANLFTRELFDGIKSLHESDKELLLEIAKTTKEPLIEHALHVFATLQGITDTTYQDFNAAFDILDAAHERSLKFLLKPIIILTLAKQHPEIKDKLSLDSASFPYRMFREEKKRPFAEVIKEVDEEVALQVLEAIPEELVERIYAVAELVDVQQKTSDQWVGKKYVLARNTRFSWKSDNDSTLVSQLDGLCDSADIRRSVFNTLNTILYHRTLAMHCAGQTSISKKVDRKSVFSISKIQYAVAMSATTYFAKNQMLGMWQRMVSEGHDFSVPILNNARSALARHLGLKVRQADNEKLTIAEFDDSVLTYTIAGKFLPSSKSVPFCMCLLARFHKNAVAILQDKKEALAD